MERARWQAPAAGEWLWGPRTTRTCPGPETPEEEVGASACSARETLGAEASQASAVAGASLRPAMAAAGALRRVVQARPGAAASLPLVEALEPRPVSGELRQRMALEAAVAEEPEDVSAWPRPGTADARAQAARKDAAAWRQGPAATRDEAARQSVETAALPRSAGPEEIPAAEPWLSSAETEVLVVAEEGAARRVTSPASGKRPFRAVLLPSRRLPGEPSQLLRRTSPSRPPFLHSLGSASPAPWPGPSGLPH